MKPPIAKQKPETLAKHGHQRIDNYYWMRERENSDVIAYLEAENAYTEEKTKHLKELKEELFTEMKGRIKEDDNSVPYFLNGYFYYNRYEQGKEYPIHCRKKDSLESPEEIILDVNKLAKDQEYCAVVGLVVSPNGKWLKFSMDTVGRRIYTLYIKNLETGEILAQSIPDISATATWANDNETIFYVSQDPETLRPDRVWKYKIGQEPESAQEVFYEADDTFYVQVSKTKSQQYILISSWHTLYSEFHILEADKPDEDFNIFQPRERKIEYHVEHYAEKFYILTNWQAQNFRLMSCDLDRTPKENWQEFISHREDVLLENIELFNEFLVLSERKNGLEQLRVLSWDKSKDYYIPFTEPAYTAWIGVNADFTSKILRYGYNSMTIPTSVYDFDIETKEQTLLKQQEIVGGYNPEEYQSERLYATAKDGKQVPISLVYKKEFKPTEASPLLLYGYGSYGINIDPNFSSTRLSLLNRGFVFAIAHIRGSETLGRQWYEDGKYLKKKNTFTDFIASAEFLVENKYSNPEKLFALGGSAGGLLMGAVMNMRPDLFKGMIAAVPFVDVVTTMLDETIPLTTGEYDEWGNPNNKEYYEYMLSYSPYDQVKAQDYPNVLVLSGLHDSQVQYWEPTKWVAKLRELKTDDNLLLLKTDMGAGHSGKTGRFKRLEDTAFEYAFLLGLLDI